MITNATLLRIDAPPAVGDGGDLVYIGSHQVLSTRCLLDQPNFQMSQLINQLQLESTAVLYVAIAALSTAAQQLVMNARVVVQLDGLDQQTMRIDRATPFVFGGVSHVQCLVREM